MEKVKKVIMYRTKDGKLYEDIESARKHEKEMDFENWYKNNELLGNYEGSYVKYSVLIEWLKENYDSIVDYLGY